MYEVEIEYPDGSKEVYYTSSLESLKELLKACEIESIEISRRRPRIAPNPFTKKP